MRIRRSLSPPPDLLSSILQQPPSPPPQNPPFYPTKATLTSSTPPPHHRQHVMVSRINARLIYSFDNGSADSKDTVFNTQDEATTEDSCSLSTNESSGHGAVCVQTSTSSSVSSSLSDNGRWCEEERAIPLKKRRVGMMRYERKRGKEMMKMKQQVGSINYASERKREAEEKEGSDGIEIERCKRVNGKGWRCRKMRVKGRSLCNHHLQMQRMRNITAKPPAAAGTNQIFIKGHSKRVVKARSISSLLRDTVPFLG